MSPPTPQYVAPAYLIDRAKELNDKFHVLLNQIVKVYPDAKFTPSSQDSTKFNTFMNLMRDNQSEYFLLYNDVIVASETLSKTGKNIDAQIEYLNTQIKLTKGKLDDLKNSGYSAEGMLDDTKLTRNQVFFGNVVIFLILAGSCYMIYKKGLLTQSDFGMTKAPGVAAPAPAGKKAEPAGKKAEPASKKAEPAGKKAEPAGKAK